MLEAIEVSSVKRNLYTLFKEILAARVFHGALLAIVAGVGGCGGATKALAEHEMPAVLGQQKIVGFTAGSSHGFDYGTCHTVLPYDGSNKAQISKTCPDGADRPRPSFRSKANVA